MPSALARGDVVLTRFPFTDLTGSSVRPALVISDGAIGNDLILAGISSVVRQTAPSTDVLIDTSHPEFKASGLRVASVIRLHKLVTVDRAVVVRRLGRIGNVLKTEVDQVLRGVLKL